MNAVNAVINRMLQVIDFICIWTGKITAFLVIPLLIAVVIEVTLRYGFNQPTIWAFETERMVGGTLFVMGFSWVLIQKAHVRVDLLYQKFSPRGKAILDATLYLLLVFPLWIWVMPQLIEWTQISWEIQERSSDSAWRNIIYPHKTVAPIAIFLLLIGLFATFVRDIRTIIRGH